MATDLEKLVVQLSADFKSYETAMAKASGITRKELASIKAQAEGTGGASVVAFTGATKGVQRFGAEAKRAQSNVSALRAQTGNLAAQFQDIGVQLAGGQSPFQIALQQGTQISAVLGGQGARGAVGALAGAFASLVSPVSLVTIGLIAAGGAAVQYFSSLLSDSDKSEEALKRQAGLIQQVAKEWGAAVPALRAYAAEQERLSNLADLQSGGDAVLGDIWAKTSEQVETLRVDVVDLISTLQTMGADADQVREVQAAFEALATAVDDQKATGSNAERVQAALNATTMAGTPLVDDLAAAFAGLIPQLNATAVSSASATASLDAQASALTRAAGAMREYQSSRLLAEQQSKARLAQATSGLAATEDSRNSNDRGVNLTYEDRVALTKTAGSGGGGGRSSGASGADREREAVTKLIEQLTFEQSMINATDLEREKANALRRAGSSATEEQRAQIAELVTAIYTETEALRQSEEQMAALQDLSRNVLGGIVDDLIEGASAADVLRNALSRVGATLLQTGLDGLIEAAFKGGAGGGVGGILGSLFGGRRALGGSVSAGRAYLVGEKRPELFVPSQNGTIIPRVPASVSGGGAGGGPVQVVVDVRGATGNQEVRAMVASGVAQGMAQVRREVPGIMFQSQRRTG